MKNIFLDEELYKEYKDKKEKDISKRILIDTTTFVGGGEDYDNCYNLDEMDSKYKIKVETYKHKENKYWDILKVIIYEDDKELFYFVRDYHTISFCYAKENNKNYLIFSGENYMGFSIYNLTDKTFFSYIPNGYGWCPVEILDYFEYSKQLYAYGCNWGCEFEYRYYKMDNLDNPSFDNYESIVDD